MNFEFWFMDVGIFIALIVAGVFMYLKRKKIEHLFELETICVDKELEQAVTDFIERNRKKKKLEGEERRRMRV